MIKLCVTVEKNGKPIKVGVIKGNNTDDARFSYLSEYLNTLDAAPLSISLPLSEDLFTAQQTKNYFEGLLPEGFTRRSVASWLHVDEGDYLSILHGLGRECLGAVYITEEGEEISAEYEPVTKKQIKELAHEGATKSAEIVTKTHLSLTGASGKVGLYYSSKNKKWYLPWGTAPSTHIVKQSHVRLDGIVTNEQLCMMTAKRCGIEIPECFIVNTGEGNEDEVLFATKRYDRIMPTEPEMISGLPRPLRLHQEDFAQAMGISASNKYEPESERYMKSMFDIIARNAVNPVESQFKLWDIIVFDYLIGNTDAHIKNFSILYSEDLKTKKLAPAYDIVSTTVYEQSTREMAFSVGGVRNIDEIDKNAFSAAAKEIGISEKMALQRFDRMAEMLKGALSVSANELEDMGFPKAEEMKKRILNTGGIKNSI